MRAPDHIRVFVASGKGGRSRSRSLFVPLSGDRFLRLRGRTSKAREHGGVPIGWVRNKRRKLALRLEQVRSRGLLGVFAQRQGQALARRFPATALSLGDCLQDCSL